MSGITPPTTEFPYPTLPLKLDKLKALTKSLEDNGFHYGFGSKINPISLQAHEVAAAKRKIDCSGFVRWVVWHGCGKLNIPDGSANQHAWFASHEFKFSTPDALLLKDGYIRVAILNPQDGHGVGHIMFVCNGVSFESHGGVGPDSRVIDFDAHPWMTRCHVFVLQAPEDI